MKAFEGNANNYEDILPRSVLSRMTALKARLERRAALFCKELIKFRVAIFPVVRRRHTGEARIVEVRIVELDCGKVLEGLKIALFLSIAHAGSIQEGNLDVDPHLFQVILPGQHRRVRPKGAAQEWIMVRTPA
jgi:hypothetical protein